MKRRISYKTDEDIKRIEAEQAVDGFKLVEVQNHVDGDFLVFDDGRPEITVEEWVWSLEKRVNALEDTYASIASNERSD
jgi:hypothetical protein